MNAWRRASIPINPERIAKLATLGLNEQQARAYLSLLDVETATVNDIAKESRVPRAKLYEVLETLSRKGLLDIIPETPQRFRANPLTALYDTRL
ncbi:MAG TPA: helix-turn-helix domain-containing protein, partial [Candidatus Thermoplasmatota archaeon]|nr:helix-turn-helix domain-containing protein [Candidatus Thermoplasmatota archaeon]